MSCDRRVALWRKRIACAALSGQVVAAVHPVWAARPVDRDALSQCAAVAADDRRLACYDALAGRAATPPAQGEAPAGPGTTVGGAPPAPRVNDEKSFGLTKPVEPVARGPESLHALVTAITTDTGGNVTVLLDNGQSWVFTDANALLRKGDTVVIKRAALGSFMMSTPSKRTYNVRRIK